MCGICGIIHFDGRPPSADRLSAMTGAMVHRGPDDEGRYLSSEAGPRAALGFRRLSIIDLSEGHQPMRRGRNVIVFNGEIYNYRELRREEESAGFVFQTHSDTEVLLHLYERYGEDCLKKLNGMFAFAVWNEDRRDLFLARDRLGIKPLYYFYDGKTLAFASEMKSLLKSGEVPMTFDPAGVRDFYTFRFVPGPHSVLRDVKKVLPGRSVRFAANRRTEREYWTLDPAAELRTSSEDDLADELESLLEDAVRLQLVSDVPLGVFLSGGVDSSLVTALMTKLCAEKVRTFSIGFESGTGVDERPRARRVADFLGTEHHAFTLTEKELGRAASVFSRMNEPVADPTILPTALLSEFARREVKVVLTGEGGDELFAGYNRYKAVVFSGWVRALPAPLRPMAGFLLRRAGHGAPFRAIPRVDAGNWAALTRDFSLDALRPLFGGEPWTSYLESPETSAPSRAFPDALNGVLDFERRTSLTDRLLMKVDMAAMGRSLEARPPYLDHRVVEFAFRVPDGGKIRRFKGKRLLRKVAERRLPADICRTRKHGFIVPLEKWMKAIAPGSLEELLDEDLLRSTGVFDGAAVLAAREKAFAPGGDVGFLWPLIVLSGWIKGLNEP